MPKEDIKEVFTKDFLFDYQPIHVNLQQTEDCKVIACALVLNCQYMVIICSLCESMGFACVLGLTGVLQMKVLVVTLNVVGESPLKHV